MGNQIDEASLQYKALRVLNRYKNSNDMFILKLKVHGLLSQVYGQKNYDRHKLSKHSCKK